MAIVDLPTTAAFAAARLSLSVQTSSSGFTGFFTGNRERRSHLADRLRMTLTLPPCKPAAAAEREAFLLQVASTGDYIRTGMAQRARARGSLRGTLVAAANAAAGARSISISGGRATPNLLAGAGAGFDVDADSSGIADGWQPYFAGAVSGADYSRVAGNNSPFAQRMFVATMGSSINDQVGISRPALEPVTAGQQYSLAADWIASASTFSVEFYVDWINASGGVILGTRQSWPAPTSWQRLALQGMTAPAGAASARVYAWMHQATSGSNLHAYIDNLQFEQSPVSTPYAGPPALLSGDWLSVGGNLLQVGFGGATLDDMGTGAVPLTLPLQRAVTTGAAVNVSAPTGLWELDDAGLQLDYSAPSIQGGIALPLLQVVL